MAFSKVQGLGFRVEGFGVQRAIPQGSEGPSSRLRTATVVCSALVGHIRIGFRDPLYYNYDQEPPEILLVIISAPLGYGLWYLREWF